jgi:hypothetical protein
MITVSAGVSGGVEALGDCCRTAVPVGFGTLPSWQPRAKNTNAIEIERSFSVVLDMSMASCGDKQITPVIAKSTTPGGVGNVSKA